MAVDFEQLRRRMVDRQIRTVDVTDLGVLKAFLIVSREMFLPEEKRDFAYLDREVTLDVAGRALMRPTALARLVQLAKIDKGNRVLDVGAATGYASAILSHLAARVVALECDRDLSRCAADILQQQNCHQVEVVCAPLEEGHKAGAPYDVILCEGSVDFIPPALHSQLRKGGRLVAVRGHGLSGEARVYIREHNRFSEYGFFNLVVPPLPGFQREAGFVF